MGDINAHARLAPSHADTWVYCPGSINLESTLPPAPDNGETEHSRRGTAAHEAFEQCVRKGVARCNYKGQTMSNGVTLNAEDNAAIQVALDWVEERKAHAASKRLPFQIFSEEKVEIGRYLGRDDLDGTVDFQMFYGNTLELADYKHGYTHVEAQNNLQLILYAIGAMAKAYDPATNRVALSKVRLTIIQPRGQNQDQVIRTWEVQPDDLFDWSVKLKRAAAATDSPDAPLIPGDIQCRWCRVARESTCPARTEEVAKVFTPITDEPSAPVEIHEATAPGAAPLFWNVLGDAMGKNVAVLPLETRLAIYEQTEMISAWLKANGESLKADAMRGVDVPGYMLEKRLGNREWAKDDDTVAKKLSNLKHRDKVGDKYQKALEKEEYIVTKVKKPSEAFMKKVKDRVSERSYKNFEKLVIRPETGPFLVPVAEGKTPWKPPAEEIFEPKKDDKPVPSFLL